MLSSHAACMVEKINAYEILTGKSERKSSWKTRSYVRIILKSILNKYDVKMWT
jgi:hypothetical protein